MIIHNIKKQNNNNGLTLIEVLVAIVILVILAMALIPLTGLNFTNIFTMSEKSKAISKAKEITDELHHIVITSPNIATSEAKLDELDNEADTTRNYHLVKENDDLLVAPETHEGLFAYEYYDDIGIGDEDEPVEGFKITVVVFYNHNKNHVKLESFIYQPTKQGEHEP